MGALGSPTQKLKTSSLITPFSQSLMGTESKLGLLNMHQQGNAELMSGDSENPASATRGLYIYYDLGSMRSVGGLGERASSL